MSEDITIAQGVRFRPLAGISCFLLADFDHVAVKSFRPLAGISCFGGGFGRYGVFCGFRPLAGISCFILQFPTSRHFEVFVP